MKTTIYHSGFVVDGAVIVRLTPTIFKNIVGERKIHNVENSFENNFFLTTAKHILIPMWVNFEKY